MKIKSRTVGSLIKKVVEADTGARINYFPKSFFENNKNSNYKRAILYVWFESSLARTKMIDSVDLPVLDSWKVEEAPLYKDGKVGKNTKYFVKWDCSSLLKYAKPKLENVEHFSFDGKDDAVRARKGVTEQEEDAAELIGGQRHVGSGALSDLKSDASSDEWQLEAKQTKAKSFRIELSVLDKIAREARTQERAPMVHIRFTDIPEHMVVPEDWVLISAEKFGELYERAK